MALINLYVKKLLNYIRWRAEMSEHTFIVVLAALIGLLGGLGAVGFRWLIKIFQRLFFGSWEYSLELAQSLGIPHKLFIPAIGGLFVGLIVYFFAREAKGHGVPEVIESVVLRGGTIRPRVVAVKALASAICIGSGGSVGREGPIVQIGSSIGSSVGQLLKIPPRKLKTLVGCGASAGIAATFNAPVAGALFAVEVILGDFGVPQFSPIVISSVIATVISRHFVGNFPAFDVPQYNLISPFELIPYAILGFAAALVGVAFTKLLYKTEDIFDSFRFPEYLKPVLGGLGIGLIALVFPQIYGVGYESITSALGGTMVWSMLLILVFIKMVATCITLGSGGSGGIFAPSLFLGAMLGGFTGNAVHSLFPALTAASGAYALVAMGAVVAATTHAPLTAILIIFEMTSDYKIILPLMITCIISTLVSTRLKHESIYTMKLLRRGVNIFAGRELNVLKSLHVRDVLTSSVETIPENLSFSELLSLVDRSRHINYFVTDKDGNLSGVITFEELRRALIHGDVLKHLLIAKDIVNHKITTVTTDDDLDLVMKLFGQKNIDELPVVETRDRTKLIGTVWRQHVIEAYNREIDKRDLAGGVASMMTATEKMGVVDLADGYQLIDTEIPGSFVGKTIAELKLRKEFGIEVILIKKTAQKYKEVNRIIPRADYIFERGDAILVAGEPESLRRFHKI